MAPRHGERVDISYVFRRLRPSPVDLLPDPALMSLVEKTGARARSATTFADAVAVVLADVAGVAGWVAGHCLVPAPGGWASLGRWHADPGLDYLRRACVDAPAAPAAGHLALALDNGGTHWALGLGGLRGTDRYDTALAAGIVSVVASPVYAYDTPAALLEWYLPAGTGPWPDLTHSIGHLSAVLTEVAERPAVTVPAQRARGTRQLPLLS